MVIHVLVALLLLGVIAVLVGSRKRSRPLVFEPLPYPDEEYVIPPVRQEFDWGD